MFQLGNIVTCKTMGRTGIVAGFRKNYYGADILVDFGPGFNGHSGDWLEGLGRYQLLTDTGWFVSVRDLALVSTTPLQTAALEYCRRELCSK